MMFRVIGHRRIVPTLRSLHLPAPIVQSIRQPLANNTDFDAPVGVVVQSRLYAAAATTGAQKRAIQHNQISPSTKTTSAPPKPSGPTQPVTTNADNTTTYVAALAGGLVVAGASWKGYEYYNSNTNSSTKQDTSSQVVATTDTKDKVKEETTKPMDVVAAEGNPKEAPSSTVDASPSNNNVDTSGGNRVTSVIVPSKMKNTSTNTEPVHVNDHPPTGNRVTNVNQTTTKMPIVESTQPAAATTNDSRKNIIDTKSTHEAIQELQNHTTVSAMESLVQSHQTMWSNPNQIPSDATTSSNSKTSTDDIIQQLQTRIGQLQYELQDRTKWEAIRLKEFLVMKEKEVTNQYLELLQKQRLEFEDLMAKKLREQEHVLSQQLYQAIQEKEATIQHVLATALETQKQEYEEEKKVWEEMTTMNIQTKCEEQFLQQLEEYKNHMAIVLQEKVQQMQALSDKLQQLQTALEASKSSKEGSLKAHRISAAALALAEKLEGHHSAKTELETLKLAAGNVGVISTACATIPPSVSQNGVPTLSELQARFVNSIQPKCRQAAFVPKGRLGLEGQLAGMLFSTIRYAPSYDDVAPESDSDNAEYVLVRASRYVQLGELEPAVEELEKLTGQPAFVVSDWMKDAIDRINVEKALKVIKMECALLNESCLDH